MTGGKACPVTGGAHRFAKDQSGVSVCPCGEIEMSLDDQLALAEVVHNAEFGPLPPRPDRRRLVQMIADTLASVGQQVEEGWVEKMLNEQEDSWVRRQRALDEENQTDG